MDERGNIPRYDYLYRCIKADILQGKIKSGERLPAKRTLAEHLAVSVVTVENAYDQLLSEGYIFAKERSGYFVSPVGELPPMPELNKTKISNEPPMPEVKWKYNFSSNTINEKYFPFSVWSKLLRETLTCGGEELLRRSPFNGEKELRRVLSAYLLQSRGIVAPPENIVVSAGTESLYTLLVQLLGRERVYAVENPSYSKIAKVYFANGVRTAFVGLDEQGIRLDELKKSKASVLHISPSHHYPTGVVTGFSRRLEILSWAKDVGGYIIEDDYDSEFRLVGKPIQPMQTLDRAGRVIYINTFSKTLAPSIRIGYMVLPDGLMEKFRQKLGFYACPVPTFEQLTLAKFIGRGYFDRHLSRMRNVYRKRRDEAMEVFLHSGYPLEISEENSGLHFLVKLKTELSDEKVKALAAERGVKISFLSDFALTGGEEMQHCIVVNYSEL
jgi:GntR family transcriptional regulator/MocR family aminotransferase